ncbi:MAG: PadR family transcriptional regulator [Conexivisphaerales archaeon]
MAFQRLFSKLTKENLWIYILSVLKEGPDYGLSLRRKVTERFNVKAAKITFYFVLYRMEKEGLVTSQRMQGRRLYSASQKGIEELKKAIELLSDTLRLLES